MLLIDKVAWIHLRGRKLLMVQPADYDWPLFPGGEREPGESDLAALIRELDEELSITFYPDNAKHFGTFKAPVLGCEEPTEVQASCWMGGAYEGSFTPKREIKRILWITRSDRAAQTPLTQRVLDILSNFGYID